MVGAIGHATLSAAGQPGLDSLVEEWGRGVRAQFGDVMEFVGRVHGDPAQIVVIVLFPDEATYQRFDQQKSDAWAQRFLQHIDGDIHWETIEVNQV